MSQNQAFRYANALLNGSKSEVFAMAFGDRRERIVIGEALMEMGCSVSLGTNEKVMIVQKPKPKLAA